MPVEVEEMKMARLIDADKINYHEHTECMGHGDFETVRTVTDKEIAEIPTADVAPVRHERWEKHGSKWQCTGCKVLMSIDGTPQENLLYYCPFCGAKMDKEEE